MNPFRIRPGQRVRLERFDPRDTSGLRGTKRDALARSARLTARLEHLQEMLFADHRQRVLVVLQGLDTSGKDGTIRHVFEGVNPQGVRVVPFRRPTPEEADHDFLWRAHRQTPAKGEIVIFNRSHYEDVLIARADKLVPKSVWKRRYEEINEFERLLSEEGTTILKFYLHISKAEQKRRLEQRLADPTKHWKFSLSDVSERRRWPSYIEAFEAMLEKTSTEWAPWYVVPSDFKWYRDLVVSTVLVDALRRMELQWPPLPADLKSVVVT